MDSAGVKHKAQIKTICQSVTPGFQYTELGIPVGYNPGEERVMTSEQAIYSEDRGETSGAPSLASCES